MVKSITHFLIIVCIFQQLKSQISQIGQHGFNPFCDKTLQICMLLLMSICLTLNSVLLCLETKIN